MFLLLLLAGFFGFGEAALAEGSDYSGIEITEVMYDYPGSNSGHLWIEVQNASSSKITLYSTNSQGYCPGRWRIKDLKITDSSNHYICTDINQDVVLEKNGYAVIAEDPEQFKKDYKDYSDLEKVKLLKSSINISGREGVHPLKIFDAPSDNYISSLDILESWGAKNNGKSLEIDETSRVWRDSYEEGGTPGKENSNPKEYAKTVRINEIYPKPDNAVLQNEFVELYNADDKAVNLKNWRFEDRGGNECDLSGKEIASRGFLVLKKDEDDECDIALNDTQGESIALYNPQDGTPVSTAEYSGSAKEGKSYNFADPDWSWSHFLTPGKENRLNSIPEISKKKDNKIYADVYADFSAKGHDADKDKLKFTWDFGDGHKSYLKKTRHKFKKAGKYKVTLKVSDGSEDKIETFNVKVEKFPKSKVKIVSVSPNPKGKDSDSEFITLQNKSKKKINLKNWSVATGSKNLYNHPISQDVFIKPGETLKLTRDFSKFALNNTKAKMELRYPNGKVASKLAYDKKTKSIAEDEIYTKESGAWAWVAPKTEIKLAVAEKPMPLEAKPRLAEEPLALAVSDKNFSEDENLRKNTLAKFSKPQGIVLGAATFKPSFSGVNLVQNKGSSLETVFSSLNFFANYFLNKIFLKLTL